MLTFDEAAHIYHWKGVRVPNVTSIIAPLTDYSMIPAATLERARQQGIAVHKMVELDCKGELNLAPWNEEQQTGLPEWLLPYYAAWCRFKDETGFECWDAERRDYHEGLGYAGTLDLAGSLRKLPKVKGPALVDVKRSFLAGPAIGLQLVAYERMRNERVTKDLRTHYRFALRLDKDCGYRLQEYSDPDDWGAFVACLQQLRWKEKHYVRRP